MSDLMSAIRQDMQKYEDLCKLFGEEVQYTKDRYGVTRIDCYGKHAKSLKEKDLMGWS